MDRHLTLREKCQRYALRGRPDCSHESRVQGMSHIHRYLFATLSHNASLGFVAVTP
jgi:hypothetical protein